MSLAPASGQPQAPSSAASYPSAELDRRFTAFAIDRAIGWGLAAGIGYAVWKLAAPDDAIVGVLAGVGAVVLIGLVTGVLLGVTGLTLGKAVVGLRVVRTTTGRPIGVVAAVGRGLVLGVAGIPTAGLGLATLAWTAAMDPERRRRGLHDRIGDAIVVDVRPMAPEEAIADERPQQIVNLTAMRLMPVTPAQIDPPTPRPQAVPQQSPAQHRPAQQSPRQAPAAPQAPQPTSAPQSMPQPAPAPVQQPAPAPKAPPAPVQQPAPAPKAAPVPMVAPAPVQQPAPVAKPAVSPHAAPPSRPPSHRSDAPKAPGTRIRPTSPPAASAPATRATPATPPASPAPAAAKGPRWRVEFDTGEAFVVEGLALVGRRPEARSGEPVRHVVPLRSADMSLSKTHAQFQVAPDGALVVMDRGSTNGSQVLRKGHTKPLSPGRPSTLLDGDIVRFGDRQMRVRREGPSTPA